MKREKRMLDMAARAALRGAGRVEPNPLVGAVIACGDEVLGIGHHRRFGALHAEREAIESCRRRGVDVRGATMYVTLEPCCHFGKQPPCTLALIEAGIRQVVIARHDPGDISGGGAEMLREAGINVRFSDASELAVRISDPFVKRVLTGRAGRRLPWVIAKWAQTIDGKIATRTGESQWISCPASRRQVHRLRGRVDVILTGIGTVLADDPMLTVRGVKARRTPRRVVVDARLETPAASKLVTTAGDFPVVVLCDRRLLDGPSAQPRTLQDAGVELIGVPADGAEDRLDLSASLGLIAERFDATTVLVEAGPGLLGSLFEADLVDEALVYVAPMVLGDERGLAAVGGRVATHLADARRFRTMRAARSGSDVMLQYRRV